MITVYLTHPHTPIFLRKRYRHFLLCVSGEVDDTFEDSGSSSSCPVTRVEVEMVRAFAREFNGGIGKQQLGTYNKFKGQSGIGLRKKRSSGIGDEAYIDVYEPIAIYCEVCRMYLGFHFTLLIDGAFTLFFQDNRSKSLWFEVYHVEAISTKLKGARLRSIPGVLNTDTDAKFTLRYERSCV